MTDARTILKFLDTHFENIKVLYKINQKQKVISSFELEKVFNSNVLIDNLEEYDIITERHDGEFTLNEVYRDFISYLLDDFALDMPAQIRKYYLSLSELHRDLKSCTSKDDIVNTITGLNDEILKFESQLQRNINGLIKESKIIKINKEKLDYSQKMQKTQKLMETYARPLNTILENHVDSIYSIIQNIIEEANYKRFDDNDVNLQERYKNLYHHYSDIKEIIFAQNKLLIQEVMPLLDSITTESNILSGCITFLNDNTVYSVPSLLDRKRNITYSSNAKYDAQNVWEGYLNTDEEVFIDESVPITDKWIYDKNKYKKILLKSLPVDDFYQFIGEALSEEIGDNLKDIESKKFFDLSKLIFEKDIKVNYKEHRANIELLDITISVPTIEIRSIN